MARTQRGVTIRGRFRVKSRITSKAAEPGPTIMPARTSVTATAPWRNTSPVRNFYRELAEFIRDIIEKNLSQSVLPASHIKVGRSGD